MNKYIIILGLGILIVVGGIAVKQLGGSGAKCSETGETKNVTITAVRNEWRFVPEDIDVNCGDKVVLKMINEDEYDHGLGIDLYGISQRMPANETVTTEFIATKAGEFPLYCSVPCGEGFVNENGMQVKRTHFDMIGRLNIKSIISETR